MIRRRILVAGEVQGVFFREGCKEKAIEAGVSGSARNLPDGRVEVLLEGDEAAVQSVIDWCHQGPPHARVVSVDVIDQQPVGDSGFSTLG
jgi:acylphosphatase